MSKVKNKILNFLFFVQFFLLTPTLVNDTYEAYGYDKGVDYLYIPETFTWKEFPRVWTIMKFNDVSSKFTLIYSLEEADCPKKLLRNLSQTWVIRETDLEKRLTQNRRVKMWRELSYDKFEERLHNFLCTYSPPKKEE